MKLITSCLVIFYLTFFTIPACGQVIEEDYEKPEGLLRIGPEPERQIWLTERGHTLILPENEEDIAGITVFFQRGRIPVDSGPPKPGTFDSEALSRDVGILHISTGNPLDFFFDDSTMTWAASRIESVLEFHDLEEKPVFFAGLSLGGTRALKLAQFLESNQDTHWLRPAAVAVVDAPLDMIRFWHSEDRAARLRFHPAAADEGRWVNYLLEKNLGGNPEDNPEKYRDYSVYTHRAEGGGNAILLKEMPIRAYHEPDVNWWIINRRKDYYDMNSIDMAALVNQLKILGNENAELLTTHNQRDGYESGNSPHTWSIVDNADLVEWFLVIANRK